MNLLATFPGKYGDLLWALPTIRALSRRWNKPVDLVIGDQFRSIVPLLKMQPYLGMVAALNTWKTFDTAPISPRIPELDAFNPYIGTAGTTRHYDDFLHLGYREWPTPDLVRHTLETANLQRTSGDPLELEELALDEPWITLPTSDPTHMYDGVPTRYLCGFTDEHFELKYGIWQLLTHDRQKASILGGYRTEDHPLSICTGPRWQVEAGHSGASWLDGARFLSATRAFLGDCSAWHVLAVAMGKPVVLMEPNPHRHNEVFYPLGKDGSRGVQLVTGTDGEPTFDARHVREAVERVLC